VGGVLVDEDQAVLRLGDDVGLGDLAARDAEGVVDGFGGWGVGGFGAGEWGWGEEGAAV